VFGRNIRQGDEGHFLVSKVFETNHPAVTPLEALIFFDRQEHQPVATVTRYRQWLCQSLILQSTELPLKIGL